MAGCVLVIAGPTGSGKSMLAMDAAEIFNGAIVNADSMQVYRELRVMTARPSPADEARVPHRLFGVLSVRERCSAGRWLSLARAEIDAAHSDGRLPIVVGGTGLYLAALMKGLAEVPDVPAEVRAEAQALHAAVGGEAFRAGLAALDAGAAAGLPAGDTQRLIRAYEVARWTGRTLADWQSRKRTDALSGLRFVTVLLLPPRAELYEALGGRFDAMLRAGGLEEVEALVAMDLDPGVPAAKAVGVRELVEYVRGDRTLTEATTAAKQATRRYAKRQMTWLRHQLNADRVLFEQYSETNKPETFSFIRLALLTTEA